MRSGREQGRSTTGTTRGGDAVRRRRFAALLLVMGLVAGACSNSNGGGGGQEPSGGGEKKVKVALILPNAKDDFTWNQQAYEGAIAAEKAGSFDLDWVDNVGQDASSFIPVAERYAQEGYDLIIAHTFDYGEPVKQLADQYPDVDWAWAGSGIPDDLKQNVAVYEQPFYEGSFLAGILMAGASKTGKVGAIAGFDIPACHSMVEGFHAGAMLLNKDIGFEATYLGTWFDPAKEKEAALALYDAGVDIIGVCGTPTGVIEAAKEQNKGVIGYVNEQESAAPQNVLTSVAWNTQLTFETMAADVADGQFEPAKSYHVGLADGGIVVEPNPQYKDPIDQAALDLYHDVLAKVKSGAFEPPYIPEGSAEDVKVTI
jgi:basic membrane protein A and related proteins